jgi:hypothetical protein
MKGGTVMETDYTPKHRRTIPIKSAPHDAPSQAECTCATARFAVGAARFAACPRHDAYDYADAYAIHATGSFGRF